MAPCAQPGPPRLSPSPSPKLPASQKQPAENTALPRSAPEDTRPRSRGHKSCLLPYCEGTPAQPTRSTWQDGPLALTNVQTHKRQGIRPKGQPQPLPQAGTPVGKRGEGAQTRCEATESKYPGFDTGRNRHGRASGRTGTGRARGGQGARAQACNEPDRKQAKCSSTDESAKERQWAAHRAKNAAPPPGRPSSLLCGPASASAPPHCAWELRLYALTHYFTPTSSLAAN